MFARLALLSCLALSASAATYDTCYYPSQDPALSGSQAENLCTGTDITGAWALPFCAPDYSFCTAGQIAAESADAAAQAKWNTYEADDCGGEGQKWYLCAQYFPRCSDDNTVMALVCNSNCIESYKTCRFGTDEAESYCDALSSGSFPTVAPADIEKPICSSATSLLALALVALY